MTLRDYIKENNLTIENLKKYFILLKFNVEPVIYVNEAKGREVLALELWYHFADAIKFSGQSPTQIFHDVLEYIFHNMNEENLLISTMPRLLPIEDDIEIYYSDEEEAMEFYSNCYYEVIE